MKDMLSTLKLIGVKLLHFVISFLIILILPFILIINIIEKIIGKKIIVFDSKKQRGHIGKFVYEKWLGETTSAQYNRVFVYFLFPSFSAFLLFVAFPFLQGFYFSLTNWTGLNTGHESYIGFINYKEIFQDYQFGFSFFRTAIYAFFNIILINVVAFSLALLVTQKLKLKNVYRAGFFMPNLIGGLVLGYIWKFIFDKILFSFGGIFAPSWLITGNTAFLALLIVVTWQYAGYIMMIYIAAILNVPQDLVEASEIDGANAWQRLRNITLPLVAQAFTVSLFLTLVTAFKQFDTVVSLTQGGPSMQLPEWIGNLYHTSIYPIVNSTDLITMNIYSEAFVKYHMGVGQAKAIVFFVILLIVSLVQVYFNKKKEVEL
jgi:raffinose/stachyose/melibiose transport system permease protein